MSEEPEAKVEEGAEVKKEEPPTVWTKKDMTIMDK